MRSKNLVVSAFLACVLPGVSLASERTHVEPRRGEELPFSGAVLVGDTLYLSGDIGVDDAGQVPDTAAAEARAVLEKIRQRLTQAGMTMDDLVYVQVFCSDVSHYDAFNEVYRTFFSGPYPARAFIGSGKLLFDARFEVQGIAVQRD